MESTRLTDLPDEVIQNVLFRLEYANALALEATCRRFRDVANEPLLWKFFCRVGWKKWHPRHNFKAKLSGTEFTGWKALFAERTRSSRETRTLVQGILEEDLHRIPKVETIVELGWDAKDALLEGFRLAHLDQKNPLALRWDSAVFVWQGMLIDVTRFWNQEVLGCLHRAMALKVWTRLDYEDEDEQPFVWSLGALDLFVLTASRQGDIEDVRCRAYSPEALLLTRDRFSQGLTSM
jgi:F-box protein 21